MTILVFLGPSLPVEHARARLDATYLPPVAQGDVWRAVTTLRPAAIGIIDGRFGEAPAVWHKEILFALSEGVHVLGAASMGALRAAELAAFGMRGVGTVFEAYRDGRLAPTGDAPFEDDDEVAVLHGPADAGWQPLSEAMVDMRCSLEAAERARAIDRADRDLIAAVAKATYFGERTWPTVIGRASRAGLSAARATALAGWLEHHRVAQKRADALLLLDELRRFRAAPQRPFSPAFAFTRTSAWAAAIAQAGRSRDPAAGGPLQALDELRLDPASWRALRRAALLDDLVAAETAASDRADTRAALADLREQLGLADRQAVAAWSLANDAPPGFLARQAEIEGALRRLERERASSLLARMVDRLRLDGRYAALRDRAAAKRSADARTDALESEHDAPEDLYVLGWYFEDRLGVAIPDDLEAFAADVGFADAEALRRALWREFRFVTAMDGGTSRR